MPVIVPPGVNEAFHGKRAIDLHVPPTQTLQLAAATAHAPADRASTVRLFVAVVTAKGEPRSGAALSFSASRGEVSAARETSPGLYEAQLSLPPGAVGEVLVQAALTDAPGFVSKTSIALEAGPAQSIAVESAATRAVAGGAPVVLQVRALDAAGNASPERLTFAASFGEVSAESGAAGEWLLTLALPKAFQGRKTVQVVARGSQARAEKSLQLAPAAPSLVAFAGTPHAVRADGRSPVRVAIHVSDAYGNPAEAAPALSAEQGTARFEKSEGALYANYVPPLLHEPSHTGLDASLDGATAHAQLLLLPQVRTAAFSPKLGYLTNFGGFSAPFAGVEAALRSDRFGPQFALALEIDYAQRNQGADLGQALSEGTSRISLLLAHLSLSYRYEAGPRTTLWVGAGPSLAGYFTRVAASGAAQTGSALTPGAQLSLGVEQRLGFAVPFVEARAGWITRPDLPDVTGPLRTLSFAVGARFEAL